MKAIEQYFHVVLFIMLYKVGLTFKSVDETLVCDHPNKGYWAVLPYGAVYYARQIGPRLYVWGWNPSVQPFMTKESYWLVPTLHYTTFLGVKVIKNVWQQPFKLTLFGR